MRQGMWWDLLLPRRCHGCGRPGELLCRGCVAVAGGGRPQLHEPPVGAPRLFAAGGDHSGVLRAALLVHKSRHHGDTCRALAGLLGRALAVVAAVLRAQGRWREPVCVVPLPPSKRRPARFPVVELLRPLVAAIPDLRLARVLVAKRSRPQQKGLDAAARARNVESAFAVRRRSGRAPGTVLLVDDVVTTGASVASACKVLTAAGWPPDAAIAVTYARVMRR